jgi:mono/diheme cytochrome c family protein
MPAHIILRGAFGPGAVVNPKGAALAGEPACLAVHAWHHSDKQLFDMTKRGSGAIVRSYESDMPGFQDKLSDADIWAVLSYIESTWPADICAKQQRVK